MPNFSLADLEALARRALERAGANPAMADATARALVYADARGLASHGVSRIGQYATHLANGRADGGAEPAVVRASGGAVLVDARCGLAFPACALAVAESIRRAREQGIAFAGVTNSHHFGVAAFSPGADRRGGDDRARARQLACGDGGGRRPAAAASAPIRSPRYSRGAAERRWSSIFRSPKSRAES